MQSARLFYLEKRGTPDALECDEALESRRFKYDRYRPDAQFTGNTSIGGSVDSFDTGAAERLGATFSMHPVALFAGAREENIMSKSCGDMARFNRIRKQKIRMRMRIRALRAAIARAADSAKPKS
jgi:hypothetical protein